MNKNIKRIPKSEVIGKIISKIHAMYPYADPDKVKKCEDYLNETIKEKENGKIIEVVNIDTKADELSHLFEIVK